MKSVVQQEFDQLRNPVGTNEYETAFERFCIQYEDDLEAKNEISRLIKEGMTAVGQRLEQLSARIEMQTA